jgi:hypothetical protein
VQNVGKTKENEEQIIIRMKESENEVKVRQIKETRKGCLKQRKTE